MRERRDRFDFVRRLRAAARFCPESFVLLRVFLLLRVFPLAISVSSLDSEVLHFLFCLPQLNSRGRGDQLRQELRVESTRVRKAYTRLTACD